MVFFRNMTNAQSAAAWVLCGVLAYVYTDLQEKEQKVIKKNDENEVGLYNGLKSNNNVGPKRKNN